MITIKDTDSVKKNAEELRTCANAAKESEVFSMNYISQELANSWQDSLGASKDFLNNLSEISEIIKTYFCDLNVEFANALIQYIADIEASQRKTGGN